jgi:hypothetical protein
VSIRGAQISDKGFLLFCYLSFVRIQPEILYNTRETFLSNQIITSRIFTVYCSPDCGRYLFKFPSLLVYDCCGLWKEVRRLIHTIINPYKNYVNHLKRSPIKISGCNLVEFFYYNRRAELYNFYCRAGGGEQEQPESILYLS